jgi:serine phosphatase RsbU (regulator of sigma subunit)
VGAFSPVSIVERLMVDLEAFAGGLEAEDDQTLLVIGVGTS